MGIKSPNITVVWKPCFPSCNTIGASIETKYSWAPYINISMIGGHGFRGFYANYLRDYVGFFRGSSFVL